ncbi:hypothetical protein FN846DRAFT_993411 [Sphaerosporella brunnea]|uniref:Reverse transcriptase zinc-binding domain-containing protein n=1 Tax=Sphaerosporella brunnea TaxID=1250544 RepID=A0A5J5EN94_9PEZI|nr:hypothetical protein FN846DRAFT_993411 [Sphaerosporella brunnea]
MACQALPAEELLPDARGRGDKIAFKTKKAVAAHFFHLRLQKAPTAAYLHGTGRRLDDKCWWCNSGAVQTRDHKFCKRWKDAQRLLWRRVSEATKEGGRKRWPATATAALLADDRCTEAVMNFRSTAKIKSKAYYKRKAKWDKTAANAPKALASRYFQLRLNKAPTAPYLMWTGRRTDDKCWWCRKAPKQTREHLMKRCAKWQKEQDVLWRAIGLATKVGDKEGWKRTSTPVARVLADARCTEAILSFLASTHVGKWPDKPRE